MKKFIVVTYNKIPDIEIGRAVIGNVIVYSEDYGRDKFLYKTVGDAKKELIRDPKTFLARREEQKKFAEEAVKKLSAAISSEDVAGSETVYLYLGFYGKTGILRLASLIRQTGKKVILISCDCDKEEKEIEIRNTGLEIVFTNECGGRKTLKKLIGDLNGESQKGGKNAPNENNGSWLRRFVRYCQNIRSHYFRLRNGPHH